jgi:hypothetical protein
MERERRVRIVATCHRSRPLLKRYDDLAPSDPLKSQLPDPVDVLRQWDHRWAMK